MSHRFFAVALFLPLIAEPSAAQAREGAGRPPPTKEQVRNARKMIRALDDYDAQLARRQRQLEQEQRDLDRRLHGR